MPPHNTASVLNKIARLLAARDLQGYVVGGCIRDWLLGRKTDDIDIAVRGPAVTVAREVASEVGGRFVLLDESKQIARIVVVEDKAEGEGSGGGEWHLDVSAFTHDIHSDLARRDFTINAMAIGINQFASVCTATGGSLGEGTCPSVAEPLQKTLIDPFCGIEDLRDRIIRRVSNGVFKADPARLLRAVRLAAELDFQIEPETASLIRFSSQAVSMVPGERTREELLRLITLPGAACSLRYLDELGLLLAIVPELAVAKGVDQPTVHFWDVFEHSLQTVAAMEFLMRENRWEYAGDDFLALAPWSEAIDDHLSQHVSTGSSHRALLKLAALLHDIAKPETKTIDDTGRARFLGHTKRGAAVAACILGRLRFSNREIRLVEGLVYHHLRPVQMGDGQLPTQRAIYRYFRDTGEIDIDILLLALADYLASRGPLVSMEEWSGQCQAMNYILAEHERQQAKIPPVQLLDGHDIMRVFGLAPGPLIGRLLTRVHEAYASGELSTKEEALALIREELSTTDNQQAKGCHDPRDCETN
jgi:poly(A) polymerase